MMAAPPPTAFEFAVLVERFYASLISTADCVSQAEPDRGGKLLFAGELGAEADALVVAANIAGAATLVCSPDVAIQREANRDGIVDFLVTSLDEALRILKNEVRKREPVAVCVGIAYDALLREMQERGVRPDICAPVAPSVADCVLSWSVESAPAKWLPKLDALAGEILQADDGAARRWLRLAPRYLGRRAQGVRVMRCKETEAARFLESAREAVAKGEVGVAVSVGVERQGESAVHELEPPTLPAD